MVTFACYFPAEQPLFIPIEIRSDAWVMQLLEAIEVKLHSRDRTDVKVDDLRLYKVNLFFFSHDRQLTPQQTDVLLKPKESLQSRTLQWLHQQPADRQLDETRNLSCVFPNGPHGSYDKLDIIVADGESAFFSILQYYVTYFVSVLEMADSLGDPYGAYNRKVKKGAHCAGLLGARLSHLRHSSQ